MAFGDNTHTYYFLAKNGKVYQINDVSAIVIATPLLARGYYRDKPPIIAGGGAGALVNNNMGAGASAQMSGGMDPSVTVDEVGTVVHVKISGASSVLQDDDKLHEPLRYVFAPFPMVFFRTQAAISTNPTSTTFPTDRPLVPSLADLSSEGHFDIISVDCCFPWDEDCGIFNAPPQGWTPSATR